MLPQVSLLRTTLSCCFSYSNGHLGTSHTTQSTAAICKPLCKGWEVVLTDHWHKERSGLDLLRSECRDLTSLLLDAE